MGGYEVWRYSHGSIIGPVIAHQEEQGFVSICMPSPEIFQTAHPGGAWVNIWRSTGRKGRGKAVKFAEKLRPEEVEQFTIAMDDGHPPTNCSPVANPWKNLV